MSNEHETPEVEVPAAGGDAAPSEKDAAAAAAPEGGDGKDATEKEPKDGEQPEGDQPPAETPEAREIRRKNAEAARERIREREEAKELRRLQLENARLENQRLKNQGGKGGDGRGEQAASSDDAALKAEFERENPKPKEADFKTFEEFTENLADWTAGRREYVRDNRGARETSRIEREKEHEALTERLATQKEKGEAEFEDFAEVIDSLSVPKQSAILPAIYDSPDGHRVAYYLAQNPKEVTRIAALPPAAQFREVGRIEAMIEAGKIQLKKPISRAPEPAPRPGGRGGGGSDDIPADISIDTLAAKLAAGRAAAK